jgi:hypothetical protein
MMYIIPLSNQAAPEPRCLTPSDSSSACIRSPGPNSAPAPLHASPHTGTLLSNAADRACVQTSVSTGIEQSAPRTS